MDLHVPARLVRGSRVAVTNVRAIFSMFLTTLSLAGARPARADCAQPFGPLKTSADVPVLYLKMAKADWDKLRTEKLPLDEYGQTFCGADYTKFKAQFRCGEGEPWIQVAVRQKRGQQR